MNLKKINWCGLAGGVILLILVALALIYASPWWQISIGEGLGHADISPLSFNLVILGSYIVIPLILFLNLSCQLSFIASAIAIIIYSIAPEKGYSKSLLEFSYKKPLIILIIFLGSMIGITYAVQNVLQISIPLIGTSTVTLSTSDIEIEASIVTRFTWVFWLALTAAILCIAARIYHKRIVSPTPSEIKE